MSHEITLSDGLSLSRERGWHGIGYVAPETMSVRDALTLAEPVPLDWTLEKVPLQAVPQGGALDGLTLAVPDHIAVVRSDNREILHVAGSDFGVLSNGEVAEIADGLLSAERKASVETMGSLRGGKDFFVLLRTDGFDIAGDPVERYVLLSDTRDGRRPFTMIPTAIRVVCANTQRAALNGRGGIRLRHTGSLRERIEAALPAFRQAVSQGERFAEAARSLASRNLTQAERETFFADVYGAIMGPIPATVRTASDERKRDKAARTIADWISRMEGPRAVPSHLRGTAWGALNAVTEWANYGRTVRVSKKAESERDARTFSRLFGKGADACDIATDRALALIS